MRTSPARGRKRPAEEIERQKATRIKNGKPYNVGRTYDEAARKRMSDAMKAAWANGRFGRAPMDKEEKRVIENLRAASKRFVHRVLNYSGKRKDGRSAMFLGYSTKALSEHLGKKPSDDCHIDHYVPVAEFVRRGITIPAIINALPNLRWLTADENRKKNDKVPSDADAVIQKCRFFAGGMSVFKSGEPTRYVAGIA